MTMLGTIAAAGAGGSTGGQAQSFGIDVDGDGTFATISSKNGVSLDQAVHSGDRAYHDIRIAYDIQARAAGLDPASIRRGSAEDRQVLADLSQTLTAIGAAPRGQVASNMATLRAQAEATVSLRVAMAETGLGARNLATAARAPGAAAMADALPAIRGLAQAAGAVTRRTPATAVAGAAGTLAGTAIAVGAGTLNDRATPAQDRAATRAALDTNGDNVLQCREIGTWVPDIGADSRSRNAQAYQTHVTGRSGMDFAVPSAVADDVRFDGCVDQPAGATLLEAKGDQGKPLTDHALGWSTARVGVVRQGTRQQEVAATLGVAAEWHVQTAHDHGIISDLFNRNGIMLPVHHNPMPHVK